MYNNRLDNLVDVLNALANVQAARVTIVDREVQHVVSEIMSELKKGSERNDKK